MEWSQQSEFAFIDMLGAHRPPEDRNARYAYARHCVLGYIASLHTRRKWWPGVSVEGLRKRAEKRLAALREWEAK